MDAPRTNELPPLLADMVRAIATRLNNAGKQAWVVGGAVRDLVLKRTPVDADMTTDATPDEIERLFDETIAVGRAFGTIIVRWKGQSCEVTTFRAESTYSDSRHPDSVSFSTSAEVDVLRRDFTCNALYLDPITDEFLDPTHGLEDLATGTLRTVGDPVDRFTEDALRILRMARFLASPGLTPGEGLFEAARSCASLLAKVAPERRLKELVGILERPSPRVALEALDSCDALRWAFHGGLEGESVKYRDRIALLRDEGREVSVELGLAKLLAPAEPMAGTPTGGQASGRVWLAELRPSRERWTAVRSIAELAAQIEFLLEAFASGRAVARSEEVRALRSPRLDEGLELVRARLRASGKEPSSLERFTRLREQYTDEDLNPQLWITSRDLAEAKVARGPAWGELLRAAETHQLDGEFDDREAALAWLRERAQEGGNTPRSNQDRG